MYYEILHEICLNARYAVTPRRGVWGPECPELNVQAFGADYRGVWVVFTLGLSGSGVHEIFTYFCGGVTWGRGRRLKKSIGWI